MLVKMIEWFQAYSKYWPQISFFILMSNIELGQHGTQLRLALLFLIAGYGSHAGKISHFWPQYIALGSIGKYINQTRVIFIPQSILGRETTFLLADKREKM